MPFLLYSVLFVHSYILQMKTMAQKLVQNKEMLKECNERYIWYIIIKYATILYMYT